MSNSAQPANTQGLRITESSEPIQKTDKDNRHRTPFRNSLAAYKVTEAMFEGGSTSDSGDDPPERLLSSSESTEEKEYSEEDEPYPKYYFPGDKRLSIIETSYQAVKGLMRNNAVVNVYFDPELRL